MCEKDYNGYGDFKVRCIDCVSFVMSDDDETWLCDEYKCECSKVLDCDEWEIDIARLRELRKDEELRYAATCKMLYDFFTH